MTNNSIVQSYLFFDGKCEEAIEFYKKALGADVKMLMRFKDSPEPTPPGCGPTDASKVMHAQFQIGETVTWPRMAAPPAIQSLKVSRRR